MAAVTIQNGYLSLQEAKDRLSFAGTADDAALGKAIEDASRALDEHLHRRFYAAVETRTYTAGCSDSVYVDDLLTVTTLKTDDDGTRTYATSWATTDYDLWPENAALEGKPYTRIDVNPFGRYGFPSGWAKGVQVVGSFGYSAATELPGVTLGAAITDTTGTSVTAAAGTGALLSKGDRILIDSEQFLVTNISTDTLTVVRGYNGTTAATHLNAATVSRYKVAGAVSNIVLDLVSNFWHAPDNAGGGSGPGEREFGFIRFGSAFNKRLQQLAWPLARPGGF